MAGKKIRDIHGVVDVEVWADVRQTENALRGLREAFNPQTIAKDFLHTMVAPAMQARIEARFGDEGDSMSGKWAALTPATEEFRRKAGFPAAHPINERTGAMKRALVDAPAASYPHSVGATMRIPGKQPTGELAKKIKTAQVGDAKTGTPARPVLGFDEHDLETVLVLLSKHISNYQAPGQRDFGGL